MPTVLLPRSLDEIKKELSPTDRIVITTCSMCPEKCGIKVREIAQALSREYKIVGIIRYPVGCEADYVEEYKYKLLSKNPTTVLVMDCDAAVKSHQILYPNLKIVKGCISVGFGVSDPKEGYIECVFPYPGMEKYKGLRIKLYDGTILRKGGEE